jgi:hypothetical protein
MRIKTRVRLALKVCFCCIPEVHRSLGNGKLPSDTYRLDSPNITKHLTAGIRSETEVHKIVLNFRNVL